MAFYPYFVCIDSDKEPTSNIAGKVVQICVVLMQSGYCYASKFKERKAYRWAAEVTVCIILKLVYLLSAWNELLLLTIT